MKKKGKARKPRDICVVDNITAQLLHAQYVWIGVGDDCKLIIDSAKRMRKFGEYLIKCAEYLESK